MSKEGIDLNLPKFAKTNSVSSPIAYCQQVHSSDIKIINNCGFYEDCDGLISKANIALAVKSADCIPLFIYDKKSGLIGAIHVGRRSLMAKIISHSLSAQLKELSVSSFELSCFIGPHIRVEHYEVKEDVLRILPKQFKRFIVQKGSQNLFDLTKCLMDELESIGLREENIFDCGLDTYDEPRLFSYRKGDRNLFVTLIEKN